MWYSRFVGTYFEYLHFHSDFGQQILEEHGGSGQAPPLDHTLRVQQHLVGYT